MVLKYMEDQGFINHDQRAKANWSTSPSSREPRAAALTRPPTSLIMSSINCASATPDDVLFSGGLRVHTTLNYEMQKIAEAALRAP